jgi:hypothetical protein
MAETLEQLLINTLKKEVQRSFSNHPISKLSDSSRIEDFIIPNSRDHQILKDTFMVTFLLKVEKECPLKEKIIPPLRYCLGLFNSQQSLKKDIAEIFDSILETEIESTEVPNEIMTWCAIGFEVINVCAASGIDIQFSYLDVACINISDIVCGLACEYSEGKQLDQVNQTFEIIKNLKNYKVEADYFLYTLCDVLIDLITEKHNLDGIEESKKASREEVTRSSQWIAWMEELQTEDENQVNDIKDLKIKFIEKEKVIISKPQEQNINPVSDSSKSDPQMIDFYLIDEKKLNYQQAASFANTKVSVNVGIHKGTYDGQKIVVKVYNLQGELEGDMKNNIFKEIEIYQILSQEGQKNTDLCFIKFHGAIIKNNQVKIVLDHYDHNLMDYITHLKSTKFQFEDLQFNAIAYRLVFSYNYMKNLGIFHQDIKPHNILVDQYWNLRIIDFDVSFVKILDATLPPTGVFPIQGTEGYLSPELQKIKNNEQPRYFNIEKSDVYSLGLVFYQMLTYEKVNGVKNKKLHAKIESLTFISQETKDYLLSMLARNPKKRPTFSEVLTGIPFIPKTGQ